MPRCEKAALTLLALMERPVNSEVEEEGEKKQRMRGVGLGVEIQEGREILTIL